ncbi:hypothetical protein HDV63DRAFT_206353 [Trichoderma sp. SZMC 28014]
MFQLVSGIRTEHYVLAGWDCHFTRLASRIGLRPSDRVPDSPIVCPSSFIGFFSTSALVTVSFSSSRQAFFRRVNAVVSEGDARWLLDMRSATSRGHHQEDKKVDQRNVARSTSPKLTRPRQNATASLSTGRSRPSSERMQPTLSPSLSSIPSLLAADLPSRWRWSLVWTSSRVPGSIALATGSTLSRVRGSCSRPAVGCFFGMHVNLSRTPIPSMNRVVPSADQVFKYLAGPAS